MLLSVHCPLFFLHLYSHDLPFPVSSLRSFSPHAELPATFKRFHQSLNSLYHFSFLSVPEFLSSAFLARYLPHHHLHLHLPLALLSTQTVWDMSLINTINYVCLSRGLSVIAGGTAVNKKKSVINANRHTHMLSLMHRVRQTCTHRPTHGCRYSRHAHTGKYLAAESLHTPKQRLTHAQTMAFTHTPTNAHRVSVSQHQLAMSGETGWLIALCTDGHTGERDGEEESCPLSVSQHPSSIFYSHILSFTAPISPSAGLRWLSLLFLCIVLDLWQAFRNCLGKVSTWLTLMTFCLL